MAFSACGKLKGNLTIPAGVTAIPTYAFSHCVELSGVTILGQVSQIGENAFFGCTKLTAVTLPSTLQTIENGAFFGCQNLTKITFPQTLLSIGEEAFMQCETLNQLLLPENLVAIGKEAFAYCYGISSLTIPQSVKIIGGYAFRELETLTKVTLPEGLKIIDRYAFFGCKKLEDVTVPKSVAMVEEGAFGCLDFTPTRWMETFVVYGYTNSAAYVYAKENGFVFSDLNAPEYTFKETEKGIVIEKYKGKEEKVAIPTTVNNKPVVEIASGAFENAETLSWVRLPNSVTAIGKNAFAGCSPQLTLLGGEGSVTQTYAKNNNISFVAAGIPAVTLGDLNNDTQINAKDALTVLKISVGKTVPTQSQKAAADVNADGKVNAKDALEILKYAVGKPSVLAKAQ